MLGNIFYSIIDVCIILVLLVTIYYGYSSRKNKGNTILIVSIVVSIIFIPFFWSGLRKNTDEIINPTPTLNLNKKYIKLTGKQTKGTVSGKTAPNAKVKFKESTGVDDNLYAIANKSGYFKIKNLDNYTDYKVTASKKGKKSKTLKLSVSDIPNSAYTKFHIKGSNDMGSLTVNTGGDNKVKVEGTATPYSKIKIEDPDMDYSIVKTLKTKHNGKWTVTLNGPGISETDKKEKEYDFTAKVAGKLTTDTDSVYIQNPNHKKKRRVVNTDNNSTDINKDGQTTKVTSDDKAALNQAKYFNKVHMSKQGIYDQLTSSVGGQFTAEAAQYAIEHLKADYNKNALETAKNYQKTMDMSSAEIQDQLTSSAGEQFTYEEANYAIEHLND